MADQAFQHPSPEEVVFFSDGLKLQGTYHRPANTSMGAVVFLPGSRVTKETPFYAAYVAGLLRAGLAVLVIDYRGWGGSEGIPGTLFPLEQVADARNALTYLQTRKELAEVPLGLFGVSMGGAHAAYAAALDERVAVSIAVLSPMDGERMLRQPRREYEWLELQQQVRNDRRRRTLTGKGESIDQLSPPTPERARTTAVAADPPPPIPLACVEAIAEYRPIDVVARIAPRAMLWFAATEDPVCPVEHAREAYAVAGAPKRLVELASAQHYGAYLRYRDVILGESVAWLREHMRLSATRAREER